MSNAITESTLQLVTPAWNTPAPITKHGLSESIRDLGYDYSFEDDCFKPELMFIEPCDIQEDTTEMDCLTNILSGKKVSDSERAALINALKGHVRPFPGLYAKVPPLLIADLALKDNEVATEVLVRLSIAPRFNEYLRALTSPGSVGIGLFTVVASLFCRVSLPGDFMTGFVGGVIDVFESGRENTEFKMNLFLVFVSKFVLGQKIGVSGSLVERLKEFCTSHSDLEYSEFILELIRTNKIK